MTQTIVTDKDEKYNAFLYDPLYQLKAETKWSQKAGGGGLISTNREGTKRYYHFDGLGSTAALTDFDMNVTDTYVYSAFGITESSSGSSVNPFRFVGQWGYYDDGARGGQSGLLLLGVRYYSPEYGRFFDLNADFYNESFNLLAKLEFTPSYLFLTNSPSITIVESRMTQFKASYIVAPTEVPFYPSYECSIREKDCAQWYKENWKIVYYFCVAACIGIKCGRRPTLGCINSCKKECEKATKAGSPPNYAHCGKIDDPDKCQECCLKVCGGRWKCSQDCALACCD